VFISYRREESAAQAGRLYDWISYRVGEDSVFMDVDSIEPGVAFTEAIEQALDGCKALLAVIGNNWLGIRDERAQRRIDDPRDFVRLEIETALRRKVRVIPVLIDGAKLPNPEEFHQA
jgi:TIR domain